MAGIMSSGRDTSALSAIQRAKQYYQVGGAFGKGVEAGLERGRVKAISGGMQSLVSAGLAGTTMPAGLAGKYEEEVAAPTRLRVEEQRAGALSEIEMMYANMLYRMAEAEKQRKFQAKQAKLGRATQFAMAQPRGGTKFMESAAAPGQRFQSQIQFPSLYGQPGGAAMPDWMGASVSDWTGNSTSASATSAPTTFAPYEFGPPTSYYGNVEDPWLRGL